MSKKVLFAIIIVALFIVAVIAMFNINPADEALPEIQEQISPAAIQPEPAPSNYEIRLTGETLYLYTLDESGSELDKKTIEYIDIYSLQNFQLDTLRNGARFKSREAAAEFIQDLDS